MFILGIIGFIYEISYSTFIEDKPNTHSDEDV